MNEIDEYYQKFYSYKLSYDEFMLLSLKYNGKIEEYCEILDNKV